MDAITTIGVVSQTRKRIGAAARQKKSYPKGDTSTVALITHLHIETRIWD